MFGYSPNCAVLYLVDNRCSGAEPRCSSVEKLSGRCNEERGQKAKIHRLADAPEKPLLAASGDTFTGTRSACQTYIQKNMHLWGPVEIAFFSILGRSVHMSTVKG